MPQNVKMFGKLSTGKEVEGKTRRFAAKVKMFVSHLQDYNGSNFA